VTSKRRPTQLTVQTRSRANLEKSKYNVSIVSSKTNNKRDGCVTIFHSLKRLFQPSHCVTVLTVGPEMIKAKDEPLKERCLKPRILLYRLGSVQNFCCLMTIFIHLSRSSLSLPTSFASLRCSFSKSFSESRKLSFGLRGKNGKFVSLTDAFNTFQAVKRNFHTDWLYKT
jgi:hypothetical protein